MPIETVRRWSVRVDLTVVTTAPLGRGGTMRYADCTEIAGIFRTSPKKEKNTLLPILCFYRVAITHCRAGLGPPVAALGHRPPFFLPSIDHLFSVDHLFSTLYRNLAPPEIFGWWPPWIEQ